MGLRYEEINSLLTELDFKQSHIYWFSNENEKLSLRVVLSKKGVISFWLSNNGKYEVENRFWVGRDDSYEDVKLKIFEKLIEWI